MTWATTSLGRSITQTSVLLKKHLWVWPVIAVVGLAIVGYIARGAIETTMKENLRSQLRVLLSAETAMLEKWCDVQCRNAEAAANDLAVRSAAEALMNREDSADSATSFEEIHAELTKALTPMLSSQNFVGFFVADRDKHIVSSSHHVLVGQQDVSQYDGFLERVLHDGETVISAPFPSVVMMRNPGDDVRTGEPTMYVTAPIRDEGFQVIGALALQLRPELEFTQILQLGRIGDSGETYAFDKNGVMVSNSRFDNDLILLGIIADHEHSRSILNVQVRDPQGNMTQGYRPAMRRAEMPLTTMASLAIGGDTGTNVDGYRDYRGVPVVGAWTWMPEYEIGVATEIDVSEAFHAITILKRTFWILYGLLIASAIAIFVCTIAVARSQREARRAAIEAQQLGQYTLEQELGAGAMGTVYKGHHAMLQRPTAIKLLDADKVDDLSIQRFEREVQITCKLNHPSTIQVYDFGRTPEGVFYYAMEYLDGIDLQALVDKYGAQPPGRVIYLLQQACGSLFEAHSQGLVHRDIKPANLMLNRRGGEADVLKVLDFGLVKAMDEQKQSAGTSAGGLTGTPLYMSPESIQSPASVDARSDLYGLGAVGYFLLTGHAVFDATNIVELCNKHVDEAPVPPSKRLGKPISPELENAILSCLEKSRARRPQTARELARQLLHCPEAKDWSPEDADAWWRTHDRNQPAATSPDVRAATRSHQLDQTLAHGNE